MRLTLSASVYRGLDYLTDVQTKLTTRGHSDKVPTGCEQLLGEKKRGRGRMLSICQLLIQSAVHTSLFKIATTFSGNMLVHTVT